MANSKQRTGSGLLKNLIGGFGLVLCVALPVPAWAGFINDLRSEFYLDRGNSHSEKGQHDQAIQDYTEAIRLKPDFADAYYNRGLNYYKKGQYDRAIQDYSEGIRLKPDYAAA